MHLPIYNYQKTPDYSISICTVLVIQFVVIVTIKLLVLVADVTDALCLHIVVSYPGSIDGDAVACDCVR